jgi:Spy/CpxP family protein refolding chaperone
MTNQLTRPGPFFRVLALAGTILLVGALAQAAGPQAGAAVQKNPAYGWNPYEFSVPVYWNLGRKDVQEEIGLTGEQTQKLKELAKKFFEASRQDYGKIDWSKMSAEERKKKSEEFMAENKRRTDQARKEIETLLTPEQMKKLETINLRQQATMFIYPGSLLDKLELSDQQKEQLQKFRDRHGKKMAELQKQMQKLQDQTGKTILELLTSEQVKKLKEISRGSFGGGVIR